jgi:hypothetical protein
MTNKGKVSIPLPPHIAHASDYYKIAVEISALTSL